MRHPQMKAMAAMTLGMALMLLMAACGGQDAALETGGSAETTAAEAAPTATTEPMAEPTGEATGEMGETEETGETGEAEETEETEEMGAPTAMVELAESDLGPVLVDSEGRTLYAFLPDEQGASTCYDGCAGNWPPIVGEPAAGSGVDEALLGTVERDDGSMQVTYDGWPLYLYAGDSAAGDTNGQGVGEVWYVVDAQGQVVQDAAAATSTSAGGDDEEDY